MANRTYLFGIDNLPKSYEDRPETVASLASFNWSLPAGFLALVSASPQRVASLCAEGNTDTGPVYAIAGRRRQGIENLRKLCRLVKDKYPQDYENLFADCEATIDWLNKRQFDYFFLEHFELDDMNYDGKFGYFDRTNAELLEAAKHLETILNNGGPYSDLQQNETLSYTLDMFSEELGSPDEGMGCFGEGLFFAPQTKSEMERDKKLKQAEARLAKELLALRPQKPFDLKRVFGGRPKADAWCITLCKSGAHPKLRGFVGDEMFYDKPLRLDSAALRIIVNEIKPLREAQDDRPLLSLNAAMTFQADENGKAGLAFSIYTSPNAERWWTALSDPAANRNYLIGNRGNSIETGQLRTAEEALREHLNALLSSESSQPNQLLVAINTDDPKTAIIMFFKDETLLKREELGMSHPVCVELLQTLVPLYARIHGSKPAAIAITISPRSNTKYPPRISTQTSDKADYWTSLEEDDPQLFDLAFHPRLDRR